MQRGDGVVVERPTYDRTLLTCAAAGADITAVALEEDGIDVDELERGCSRRARAQARPHHPQLPEPRRLHALAGQAPQAARAGPRARLRDLRGRPVRGHPLPRRAAAAHARARRGRRHASSTRRSFSKTVCPGIRVGYLVGPADLIAASQAGDEHLHLAVHGLAVDRQRVLPLGRDRDLDRHRARGAAPSAPTRWPRRSSARSPTREFVAPDGGYFLWVELPEDDRRRRAVPAAAERGVQSSRAPTSCSTAARPAAAGLLRRHGDQIDEGVRRLAAATGALV